MSHANTGLTGGLTINQGTTLVISNVSSAGTGTISDNGTLTVVTGAGSFTAPLTGSGVINTYLAYSTGSDNYRFTGTSLANFDGTVNIIPILSGGQPGAGQVIITNTTSSAMTWNVGSGATLDFAFATGASYPANVIVNGSGNSQPNGALRLDSVTLTGNVTLNGAGITIGDDAAASSVASQFTGVISDNNQGYGFTKVDPRTIILAGANTYTGPTILSAGTLQLGSPETPGTSGPLGNSPASNPGSIVMSGGILQYSSANNNDYSGRFSTAPSQTYSFDENGEVVVFATPLTSSSGSLTLADTLGGGSVTVSGANTYSGATTITTGYLIVAGSIASPVVTLTSELAGLQLNNNNSLSSSTVLTLPGSTYYPVNLNFSGIQNITTLIIGGTTMPPGTYGAPGNANVLYQNGAFEGNGIINVQLPAFWDANASDAANGANTFGGGSGNWDNNTVDWWQSGNSDTKWPSNTVATFSGTPGTVTLDGSVVADGLTFVSSGYEITNTNGVSTLTLTGSSTITVPSGAAEIDCIIAGTTGLMETGPGTLTLGGANTFTGATSIGSGSELVLNGPNVYTGGTTIGSGGMLTLGNSGTLAGGNYPGSIANNGGAFTYTSSAAQTLSGIISGSGTITQDGPGALTLSGLNTFTGAITINAGTLTVSGAGDLGNNVNFNTGIYAGGINNSGAFVYNSSAAQTLSGQISGTGSLTLSGHSTLTLSGANSYSGATVISNGTLTLSSNSSIGNSASLSISAGATFDVSALASPYTMSTANFSASGASGAAAIMKGASGGTVAVGSQPISLTFTPQTFSGDASHQALTLSQGALNLNGNVITVTNAGASALGAGTYTLIQVTGGTLTGTATLGGIFGTGLAANANASLTVTNGSLELVVASTVVPAPVVNSIAVSGGKLVFSGTNGSAGGTYYILTSTNVALPLSKWTRAATNTFSATGTFSVTNTVSVSPGFFVIEIAP